MHTYKKNALVNYTDVTCSIKKIKSIINMKSYNTSTENKIISQITTKNDQQASS